ncbi:type IV pilus modification PilV family protein [Alienimonas chondri]|uniref:Prepilin-type N-terminal cleavage/methylation domain-containing protein n=1 Tax=Alienimonas chondri TaxID=2681879 RepID=A0ABX1VG76_9PLAN|nr:hypothetical protein [Alienimonas chondri]NNJ26267.1 hypothetical protein [Alienimonas chondri]
MNAPLVRRSRRKALPARAGLTLLEVIAASGVIALALAPALRMTRTALMAADRLDRQERCLTAANDRIETLMARTAADWDGQVTSTPVYSTVAVDGYPGMRASELTTDSTSYGGIPGRLAAIGTLTWYDEDGDASPDADEPQALLTVAVARLSAYEAHANP